ncbi:sigma-70 family RNA polymerase sigma factor [Echinicola marina]|uniref:RNA polymerase sigma factor n=1 Tax=Echinicola marina TaxID=2859768 RepID=UPI001CF6FF7E|nr:sigma-70 family RNA polymerase sigma factor [Echinicola marina]UCS93130.1 sigma-70 family RNA polymerase sigma factor [Echinicola marina]
MRPLDDLAILALIKDPSTKEKGYRQLVEQYQVRVYGIIRKMVLIHEDANDITQNTFIKAFKNIDKFKGDASIFTWLYRIATNESLNFLNKKKKRIFFQIDDHIMKMENYLEKSPHIDGDKIEVLLQKVLLKLPEKQRLVFNLRYFEELSYEDISTITETSVGALKASYHHAVKKIEKEIKEE